ncbi:ComEC/Rec2 family competence protein [Vaginella massiliensis]|uniref:ComEC/Rec2 family competence protein n=1 Tax=Vaginella massiliensis TaxID=1816680 RepID=UPI000B9B5439|nr:ComEC/Rec2 family competence protein [Vaginella massiliensis]
MKNYLFVFLFFSFALGIVLHEYLNLQYVIGILCGLFFLNYIVYKDKSKTFFSQLMLIIFIGLGFFVQLVRSHQQNETIISPQYSVYKLTIAQQLGSSAKYQKYKAIVHYPIVLQGSNFLLYIPQDQALCFPDDELVVHARAETLPKAMNPYQFDYGKFLKRRKFNGQLFVNELIEYKTGRGFFHHAAKSKYLLLAKMKKYGFNEDAIGIVGAMLLGTYSELNPETQQAYVDTGVVHVLSISGLHVMMLYGLLWVISSPVRRLPKGRTLRIVVCLLAIWCYAMYVELRPPVFRSALMISIYHFTVLLKRKPNIYHTLALSGLILLFINPNYLFEVGFQLSFSAVFFIVWLNPIFDNWVWKGNRIVRYLKGLSVTSLSAQLGTMPFATYYFNQFSWLFLLGNLLLIPASFFMMVGGIIVVTGLSFDWMPSWLIGLYNGFIGVINAYIFQLSKWDEAIWQNIYISPFTSFLIICSLICLRLAFKNRSKIAMIILLICLSTNLLHRTIDTYQKNKQDDLVIFDQYRSTLIGVKTHNELNVFSNALEDSLSWKKYIISPYAIHQRIKRVALHSIESNFHHPKFQKTKSFLNWNNQMIFIGDELNLDTIEVDYYLLRNQSLRFKQVPSVKTKRIIADASNYPKYVHRVDSILLNHHLDTVWYTNRDGFFSLGY